MNLPARERNRLLASAGLPPAYPQRDLDEHEMRPFRIAVTFDAFDGPDHARAVELARRSPQYAERVEDGVTRHQAAFDTRGARVLRDLFHIVGRRAGTEVRVDGKRVPYASELWLPLFWLFVTGEETA